MVSSVAISFTVFWVKRPSFDDDVATDVRAAWEDAIGGGASPAEATSSLWGTHIRSGG